MLPPETDPADTQMTVDCEADPVAGLVELFVRDLQDSRLAKGQTPARRPVFQRLHGVAHGTLRLADDIPDSMRVGLFSEPRSFPAWVRFSSDVIDGVPDQKGTCGIAIKLFGVPGPEAVALDERARTADLIFQNHDVFFVDTARDMCEFSRASRAGAKARDEYLAGHPVTARILNEMRHDVVSVLGIEYWSVIPFVLGPNQHCKYKLEPLTRIETSASDPADPTYLRADLHARLATRETQFRLLVQLQGDPRVMPLDMATVRWAEDASKPIAIATLTLPQQDLGTRDQATYGEALAFNPWRVPVANAPIGSIAEARGSVYRAAADRRRNVDGLVVGEPTSPRPVETYPRGMDTRIVRAAIHPAIGVARVGNAETAFFVGPEVTTPQTPEGGYRDASGAIKRQAAKFRLYGYNAAGEVVGELLAGNAAITWRVHLVNRKAAWYRFDRALDIPEAASTKDQRRNRTVEGAARAGLVIDPGARDIAGTNTAGPEFRLDSGTFQGTPVALGELRTDADGRLVVLGGHGISASPRGDPIYVPDDPGSFNNADGWYDDTSDGPVTAEVVLAGRGIPVDPAWVIVAPPDFSPHTVGWRTLYDLLSDALIEAGRMAFPSVVSFGRDILPTLQRLTGLQWVNAGFAAMFGVGGPMSFDEAALLERLASTDPSDRELRRTVLNCFRPPDSEDGNRRPWPWIYGDAFGTEAHGSARQNLPLSATRYRLMQVWAAGEHVNDYDRDRGPAASLSDVPIPEQPAMLDQAALTYCLADAFHPGCEVTWPMRHPTMYAGPYRVRHRPSDEHEPDYGPRLEPSVALGVDGPLYAQGPGDLTRWMALPWQADTVSCRSGYDPDYDPYLPTFWPARVPNQTLTEANYLTAVDESLGRDQRIAAFRSRSHWLRAMIGLPSAEAAMLQMVRQFAAQGIVEPRPGVVGDPDLPSHMLVEIGGPPADVVAEAVPSAAPRSPEQAWARRLQEAGWANDAQLAEFQRIRSHRRAD